MSLEKTTNNEENGKHGFSESAVRTILESFQIENITDKYYKSCGTLALAMAGVSFNSEESKQILYARGGNFAVVRANLFANGKANSKEPMPEKQKKLRRRKRKKK